MKKINLVLLGISIFFLFSATKCKEDSANAVKTENKDGKVAKNADESAKTGGGRLGPKTESAKEQLGLTSDQAAKLKEVLKPFVTKYLPETKNNKKAALQMAIQKERGAVQSAVSGILTPEQNANFDAMINGFLNN